MADFKELDEHANQLIAQLASTEPMAPIEDTEDGAEAVQNETIATEPVEVRSDELTQLRTEIHAANQRWKTLQGMIDKKDRELESMRQIISQMQSAPPEAPKTSGVSQEDVDNYGADLLEVVGRKARQELQPVIEAQARIIEELKAQLNGVKQVTATNAVEVFEERLTARVPQWKQINVDPAFLGWLNERDPFSGASKLQLIRDAYERLDLERSAKFFEVFIEMTNAKAAAPSPKPSDKLSGLVAPGKGRSAPTSGKEAATWTRADVLKLYDDRRTGKISESEFKALEQDMFKAQSDGRLT